MKYDMSHSYVTWLIRDARRGTMWHDSLTWLIDMWHNPLTWPIHMWHDPITWPIHMWHDWFICDMDKSWCKGRHYVTWLIDMTCSYMTWLIDMTHSYVTWLIDVWHDLPVMQKEVLCDMTHYFIWSVIWSQSPISILLVSFQRNMAKNN